MLHKYCKNIQTQDEFSTNSETNSFEDNLRAADSGAIRYVKHVYNVDPHGSGSAHSQSTCKKSDPLCSSSEKCEALEVSSKQILSKISSSNILSFDYSTISLSISHSVLYFLRSLYSFSSWLVPRFTISSLKTTYQMRSLVFLSIFIFCIFSSLSLIKAQNSQPLNSHSHDLYFPFRRTKSSSLSMFSSSLSSSPSSSFASSSSSSSSSSSPLSSPLSFSSSSSSSTSSSSSSSHPEKVDDTKLIGCPSCKTAAQLALEQIEELKLHAIKIQILSKLNLYRPPVLSKQARNSVEIRRQRALEALRRTKTRPELQSLISSLSSSSKKVPNNTHRARKKKRHSDDTGSDGGRFYRKLVEVRSSNRSTLHTEHYQSDTERLQNNRDSSHNTEDEIDNRNDLNEYDDSKRSTASGDDSYYGKTSEIIAFSEPGENMFGHNLIDFEPPHDNAHRLRVREATLWLRLAYNRTLIKRLNRRPLITRPITLLVYRVKPVEGDYSPASTSSESSPASSEPAGSLSMRSSKANGIVHPTPLFEDWSRNTTSPKSSFDLLTTFRIAKPKRGWFQLDLTSGIEAWFQDVEFYKKAKRNPKLSLLVQCNGCNNELEINLIPRSLARSRRRQKRQHSTGLGMFHTKNNHTDSVFQDRFQSVTNASISLMDMSTGAQTHQLPFLVIETETRPIRRSRRHAYNCDENEVVRQCCRQTLYVDFASLGWDDWIIFPKGYNANYCRGDCAALPRTPDTLGYYHSHIIEEYRQRNPYASIQPCCAPTKLSPISIIYMDPEGHVIKSDLPKMVVDQCGCT